MQQFSWVPSLPQAFIIFFLLGVSTAYLVKKKFQKSLSLTLLLWDNLCNFPKLYLFPILEHCEAASFTISNFVTRIFEMSSSTKSVYRRHNTTVRGHKIKMENAFTIA